MAVTPTYPAPVNPAAPVRVPATTGTRVTVYAVATGEALLRWPVDARELVASGEYTYHRPVASDAGAPVVQDAPPAAPDVPQDAPTDPAPDLPPSGEAMAVEASAPPAAAASPAVPGGDAPAPDAAPPKLRRPRRTRGSR